MSVDLVLNYLLIFVGAVLLLVAAAFLTFTGYLAYIHRKYSHLPSPKCSSFYLGHLRDIFRAKKEEGNDELPLKNVLLKWYHELKSPVFVIFIIHNPIVYAVGPECIEHIAMQTKFGKPRKLCRDTFSYMFGQRFVGNSLFAIPDYETWKPRKRLYESCFKKSYLQSVVPAFNECVDVLLDKLRPLGDGKTIVPMKCQFADFTLHVISKVAFDLDVNQAWSSESLGLKQAKNGSMSYIIGQAFKGITKSVRVPFYKYIHPFEAEAYRESIRALRIVGKDCITKRIKMLEDGEAVPNDILTHILRLASSEETVGIEDLVDDFVGFYIGGQETTSLLLSFALILLHQHPFELERVQTEVSDVLTKDYVSVEDLEKLQYTEQVLKECLRLYPPIGASLKATPPEGADIGGYNIPGDTFVSLSSIVAVLPEYVDDPESFKPSRFDAENKNLSSFINFPFGIGHRSCIGKHFAMMEVKIALARLLQTFNFSLPPDYKLVLAERGTVCPKDDVPCTLTLHSK